MSTIFASRDDKVITPTFRLCPGSLCCDNGFKARNIQTRDLCFVTKTLEKMWVNFFFTHFQDHLIGSQHTFVKPIFSKEKCFHSYIYISTMLFNYARMKMANSSPTSPNMNSIGEVCDRLGKTFLTSLVGNHLATSGLRVNSTPDYNLSFVLAQGEYNIADHT